MNKKNIIKFILDIAMAVLFITFFNKNLISFKFHIIGGYVFAAFILVHMILNKKWIINISKRLFDKKLKLRVKISYILSLFLFISIFSIIASGVLMMKATTYDRVMFWKMLHFGASYLSIALIGMHIGLYWNFIMNMFKKIFKIKESNSISKILVNSVVIIVLILGIYTTYRTEYFTKVTNTLTYVAQHIKPQDIEAPEGNGYEKEHLTFTDLSITPQERLLRTSFVLLTKKSTSQSLILWFIRLTDGRQRKLKILRQSLCIKRLWKTASGFTIARRWIKFASMPRRALSSSGKNTNVSKDRNCTRSTCRISCTS